MVRCRPRKQWASTPRLVVVGRPDVNRAHYVLVRVFRSGPACDQCPPAADAGLRWSWTLSGDKELRRDPLRIDALKDQERVVLSSGGEARRLIHPPETTWTREVRGAPGDAAADRDYEHVLGSDPGTQLPSRKIAVGAAEGVYSEGGRVTTQDVGPRCLAALRVATESSVRAGASLNAWLRWIAIATRAHAPATWTTAAAAAQRVAGSAVDRQGGPVSAPGQDRP